MGRMGKGGLLSTNARIRGEGNGNGVDSAPEC